MSTSHTQAPEAEGKSRAEGKGAEPTKAQTHSEVIEVVGPILQLLVGATLQRAVVVGCIDSTGREPKPNVSRTFYTLRLKTTQAASRGIT